ncbi:MAG: ROK family transcriptional regulator [Anaerolineae bacterium]|nr:ROK family transcriptional regulator [Anaerolineae bacterium]
MPPQISSTQKLRYFNQYRILKTLYFNEPLSRQELSRETNLSVATITNLITTWLDRGVILESGTVQSKGGRPRVMLTLNRAYGAFVGIDLGETHIRFELFDLKMNSQQSIMVWLTNGDTQPTDVVAKIVAGYRELLQTAVFPEEKVIGIGIGVPGVVEREGGISIFAPNWGWHNVSLLTKLKEAISAPIIIDNGAKAMGLAEMWFGGKPNNEHLIALLLGTGVGTAIISEGEIQRGVTNSAGEFGHTTLDINGRSCRCGGQGCIETYVGAPGIIQTLQTINPESPLLHGTSQLDIIAAIATAAEEKDETARIVLQQTANYLGAGIANLINLYNPQTIVLSGWLGNQLGPFFLELLPPLIEKYALPQPGAITHIKVSSLGDNSIAMGAASLILEDFLHGTRTSWRLSSGVVSLIPQ